MESAGGTAILKERLIYKAHRIHASRLASGLWLCAIVNMGKKRPMTHDSLTATVTRVPGEYSSEEEALHAATRYIDHVDTVGGETAL